jgi:hypothetical protein
MDPSDQKTTKKGTVLACVICHQVVVEFKKQILEKGQSFRDLEGDIEWFKTTTCQPCRDIIIRIPKVERTGVILIPARERPVAHEAITDWTCYKNLCEYLGQRPEIYRLEDWNVIENLYRLEDEIGHDSLVFCQENSTDFFKSHPFSIPEDTTFENTNVDRLDDACLGCVQCPAILPLLRRQEPPCIWFRATTCGSCREITTGRSLCPIGEIPVGLDFLKALPSLGTARGVLGNNMRFVKIQGYFVIESTNRLIEQYMDGTIDCSNFF